MRNVKLKFMAILVIASMWINQTEASPTFAGEEKIALLPNGNVIAVWRAYDLSNPNYQIRAATGSFGTIGNWTVQPITNSSTFYAEDPIRIAVSTLNTANTLAVFAWVGLDIGTGNKVLQAATLTTTGWTGPIPISLNDGSESPTGHFNVYLSGDGVTALITWTTHNLTTNNAREIHAAISTNGGQNWTNLLVAS